MPTFRSWFFVLGALEGAAATAALFLIPSEGGSLSPARLALIAFLLSMTIAWAVLAYRPPQGLERLARPAFILLAALASFAFALALFLLRYLDPESSLSTYKRLSPALWYLLVLSLQSFLFLLALHRGFHPARLVSRRPTYLAALIALSFLLPTAALISITRLGLTPDPAYWGEPGVPVLGWQLGLALIAGMLVVWLASGGQSGLLDVLLPILIYLLAVALWQSVPVEVLANSFYMPINPPAFQPFPYSDAGYYDQMAHSLLIGHPYQGTIPTRPLYVVFLAALHRIFGESYSAILAGQTLVLALIPLGFYQLGKRLHSRAAGLVIAMIFIFRELTTLWVSSSTRVSHTKTLLVDLPTLLLLILACLSALRWLERRDRLSALLAGGTFGLLLLLRTQSLLVLPFVLLAALLVLGWRSRRFFLLSAFFLLGLLAAVLPWLTHNYLQTGQLTFDAPFQYKVIASQYAYSGNLDIENYDFEGKGLGGALLEFALKDPGFVFGFITNHFLAAQVHGLLALPLLKPYPGLFEPIHLYWMDWSGSLEWYNFLLLLVYIAVIALGLGAAWRRWRWTGLLPLMFSAGYALATAVGRFSGWRYDLPADWVWYFYFGIGAAELLEQAALLFGAQERGLRAARSEVRSAVRAQSKREAPALLAAALAFALVGALPWLGEGMAAPRYDEQDPAALTARLTSLPGASAADRIRAFASQPEAFLASGRALYPRFFSKENGLASTNPWPAYAIRKYPRIGFLLLNQGSTSVVFPTKRLPEFPHAQDTIVLGCQRDGYVEARWIGFPGRGSLYAAEDLPESCAP